MLNRKIVVDLVKKDMKQGPVGDNQNDTDFADKATITGVVIESAIKKVALGVCAYVVLDTVRKVAVAYVSA